jgi:hypothetical protein
VSGWPGLASSTIRIDRQANAPAVRACGDALGATADRIDAIIAASGGAMSSASELADSARVVGASAPSAAPALGLDVSVSCMSVMVSPFVKVVERETDG